jgi:hypothetical protein
VWWYRYDWRGADAATGVINAFNHLVATAPPAFNAVAAATAVPPKPGESTRHALDVFSRGQYLGTEAELRDLVQPLLAAGGTPTQATFTQMKFWDVIRMISTKEPPSHCFGDISRYAAAPIPERATNQVVDLLAASDIRSADNNPSFWSLGWVGGDVVNSVGRTDTAYVHRGMSTLLRPTTVWADDADPSVGRYLNEWTDAVIEVLNPYTPYESYQNFPNRRITNWQQAYYAENFARLVEVKRTYDPGNLFHNAQSIPTM